MPPPETPEISPSIQEGKDLLKNLQTAVNAGTPDMRHIEDQSKKLRDWSEREKEEIKKSSGESRTELRQQLANVEAKLQSLAASDAKEKSIEHIDVVEKNIGKITFDVRAHINELLTTGKVFATDVGKALKGIKEGGLQGALEQAGSLAESGGKFFGKFALSKDSMVNALAFSLGGAAGFLGLKEFLGPDRIELAKALKKGGIEGITKVSDDDVETQGSVDEVRAIYDRDFAEGKRGNRTFEQFCADLVNLVKAEVLAGVGTVTVKYGQLKKGAELMASRLPAAPVTPPVTPPPTPAAPAGTPPGSAPTATPTTVA